MRTRTAYSKRLRHQYGITLMEVLLSLGIMSTLISVGIYVASHYTRLIQNEKAASQMVTVQNAAEEFVQSNFTQLLDPTAANNVAAPGGMRIMTPPQLSANNYLPANFPDVNALNLQMRVCIRNDTNPAPGSTPVIEVTTLTRQNAGGGPQPFQWIYDAAQFGKGRLGILANIAGFNQVSFTEIGGQWRVPVANLCGWASPLPAQATDASGYLAAYGRISSEDIFDSNVLYRIPVAGQPDLNRMQADLNMNNHQMDGVGTMTVDNLQTGGVNLTRAGGYALTTTDTLAMTGDTSVNGNVATYGNFAAANANLPAGTASADSFSTQALTSANVVSNDINTTSALSRDMVINNTLNLNNANVTTSNLQLGSNSGPTLTTNRLNTPHLVAGATTVTNAYKATSGGTHQITDNLRLNNGGTIRTLAAQEVHFTSLCYTSGPKDGIPGC